MSGSSPVAVAAPSPDDLDPAPTPDVGSGTGRRFDRFRGGQKLGTEPQQLPGQTADDRDRLAPFRPAVAAVRLTTIGISIGMAVPYIAAGDRMMLAWSVVLAGLCLYRTKHPMRFGDDTKGIIRLVGEAGLVTAAVALTGSWSSPFTFVLLLPVVAAGFAGGFALGLRLAGTTVAAVVGAAMVSGGVSPDHAAEAIEWVAILLIVAVVAGYGRRITGEANRQHSAALARLGRLSDANALLYSLHRVAQTLPASFDLDEVLDTTVQRLKDLLDFDALAILVLDETEDRWIVTRREGPRLPASLALHELPDPLFAVLEDPRIVRRADLVHDPGPGLVPTMGSGLYAPLRARGAIIGLLSVEAEATRHFDARDAELLTGFVDPAALAIDNARWFARLRTVGADEERTRIARDLHDRIGQSLAYLAFELDRLVKTAERGEAAGPALDRLRTDVRGVIGEVRDTLYDLRTDVSDEESLLDVLEQFGARVAARSDLVVEVTGDRRHRAPLLQERELWRIAQEALVNVERHARASRARISWRLADGTAVLEVLDDGEGFPSGVTGRLDSYGMLGMRERASSIGASLEVHTAPGKGTRVRCLLDLTEG